MSFFFFFFERRFKAQTGFEFQTASNCPLATAQPGNSFSVLNLQL